MRCSRQCAGFRSAVKGSSRSPSSPRSAPYARGRDREPLVQCRACACSSVDRAVASTTRSRVRILPGAASRSSERSRRMPWVEVRGGSEGREPRAVPRRCRRRRPSRRNQEVGPGRNSLVHAEATLGNVTQPGRPMNARPMMATGTRLAGTRLRRDRDATIRLLSRVLDELQSVGCTRPQVPSEVNPAAPLARPATRREYRRPDEVPAANSGSPPVRASPRRSIRRKDDGLTADEDDVRRGSSRSPGCPA